MIVVRSGTPDAPSADEFEQWAENPVTKFVMAGLLKLAASTEQRFRDKAWAGHFDPAEHAACIAQVEAYTDLANITHADAVGANGMEIAPDVEDTRAG